ncbi:restriction endonuclease subunit S [Aequorivita sinensis]|uniref:restriction endonuclease subunit S n=1 Tax=Aequorivita sinensis TaxID=1382458 RepID=UPI0011246F49|nr:restriction endonuclease subunit S [Aequorivita sinensis]
MSSVEDKIPEGWVETTLGEVSIRKQYGYTESASNEEIGPKFLRITDIQNDFINWKTVPFCLISDSDLEKYKLKIGDVVIARTGNSTGATATIKEEINAVFASYLIRFQLNSEIADYNFIDFLVRSRLWSGFVKSVKSGSAQGGANANDFAMFPINLPPLQEQKAIAEVLTAFDDKIENLRAQNQTLETLAQTIFAAWFLPSRQAGGKYQVGDELPEGWRVGEIGDLTVIKRGGSPRPIKDYISDSGYRWLKISDATATDSPYIFEIKEHIKVEGLSKTTLKKAGDLVLSNSATPGMPKFLAVDTCVHDGWMHFPSSIVSNEYLYLLFLHIRPKLVQQGSGSVFVNLKTDILRYYETIIPSNQALKDFDKLIKPVFDKILNNSKQIQSLTKTRDTLLPKLMSGELRVEGFKK